MKKYFAIFIMSLILLCGCGKNITKNQNIETSYISQDNDEINVEKKSILEKI